MSTTTSPLAEDWRAWRRERESDLATEHGWLSLTALHWLDRSPRRYEDLPGSWWFDDEGIWVEPDGADLSLDGVALATTTRVSGTGGAALAPLRSGERVLELIGRGEGNRGVRVRDPHADALTSFSGVPTFEFDAAWRIDARYEPLVETQQVAVGSASPRVQHVRQVIGHAVFEHDGGTHRLAVSGGHAVQVAFRDATSGRETFGLLRQLAVEPQEDGTVVLDFNRATNPPCSFSEHGTCPLPVPGNTLPFAVVAGEKTPLPPA